MNDRIDLLNREDFIENVITIVNQLSENKKGCCFAIEGGWGIGKTFVIEEVEEKLKLIQSEETNDDRYFVFHYNCWQYDYYEEPAVAIISAMLASIQKDSILVNDVADDAVSAAWDILKEKLSEIAGAFIENKIGVNLISVAEDIEKKRDEKKKSAFKFDELFNFSQTIEKVRKKLQEITQERTIVLIVDELDRCIPQYAIKVLERLHHIFYGLENVVIIMAIDRKQLEHSVEEMFGAKNDSGSMDIEKYLKKFIDFSMVLENGKINDSLREKYAFYFDRFTVEEDDAKDANDILSMLFSEMDIRRQEKLIEKANLVHSIVSKCRMDISVLVFEVMYEVLRLWGVDNNSMSQTVLRGCFETTRIGVNEEKVLSHIVEGGYKESITPEGERIRDIDYNLYGNVYWYFIKLFYKRDKVYRYAYRDSMHEHLRMELMTVKRYCELCDIVK